MVDGVLLAHGFDFHLDIYGRESVRVDRWLWEKVRVLKFESFEALGEAGNFEVEYLEFYWGGACLAESDRMNRLTVRGFVRRLAWEFLGWRS